MGPIFLFVALECEVSNPRCCNIVEMNEEENQSFHAGYAVEHSDCPITAQVILSGV